MKGRQNRRWNTMDKSDLDLSTLIKHLEIHNRTEGKSPRTVEWYNEVLGLLYRWLQEESLPTNLGSGIHPDLLGQPPWVWTSDLLEPNKGNGRTPQAVPRNYLL